MNTQSEQFLQGIKKVEEEVGLLEQMYTQGVDIKEGLDEILTAANQIGNRLQRIGS